MDRIVKTYRKRLYDLTTGNRSLLFLRLSAAQELDLSELNFLDQHAAFHYIEELLTEKKNIRLAPIQEPRVEKVQIVSSTLKKIYRKLGQIYEERGLYECYVGWLFAEGKWKDGTPFRAPLLFFTVQLEIEGNYWTLKRDERSIHVNKSLLLAFSHYHDLIIPDEILEEDFEDFSSDPLEFRTQIYEWLKKSKLEFLFSKEYFQNEIPSLKIYKRQEYEEVYALGEMRIQTNAVLGIFPQAGSTIAADYDVWSKQLTETSLEHFFADRNNIELPNDPYKEDLMTPYSMDASQEFAVREVLSGKSIVIQGPPGSGKSETICNMVCSAIAAGKKILVMSHKRAALEVVAKRLGQKSLNDFYALVHDVKFDQRTLYTKINQQIENIEAFQTLNNGLDAIYLEREFSASVKLLTQLNTHSEEFRKALFDTHVCGYSAHELYLKAGTPVKTINLSDIYTNYPAKELERLVYAIQTYSIYSAIPFPKAAMWKYRIEIPALTTAQFEIWKNKSSELKDILDLFSEQVAIEKITNTLSNFNFFTENNVFITSFIEELKTPDTRNIWNSFALPVQIDKIKSISEEIRTTLQSYPKIFENYTFTELHDLRNILNEAKVKNSNPFSWFIYKLFSSDYKRIKQLTATLELNPNTYPIQKIIDTVEKILHTEKQLSELSKYTSHKINLKDAASFFIFEQTIKKLHDATTLIESKNPAIHSYILSHKAETTVLFLSNTQQIHARLSALIEETSVFFSAVQQQLFIEDAALLTEWMQFIETNLNDIQHLDNLLESLTPTDRICIQRLEQLTEKNPASSWSKQIEQSILNHWIQHIELVYPILKSLDTLRWKQFAQDWAIHSEKRKELSLEMILGKLREQTYRDIVFNRLQNRVTYRDLQHQVTKKKRVWPMRKLMQEYAQEVFSLIPCWMMSPEQVSCVFPLEQLFDLIIIDEASQCYTEHSLPAMYRAKQVVIAGDSQQLPPSDLYRVRWDDEAEEEADIEIDSLLDLGGRYLSSILLKGHYRSKYPELIAFSNQQFYGNKLNYIPNYTDIRSEIKPISYHKVDGVWSNSVNKIEAEKVVALTLDLIQAKKHSIGIVCFNYQQASYIQDLLEEQSIAKQLALPEELFVKNIENVQGDERDIIIFSVGYAPDKNGKFSMLFGSLNMQGGEKRMNVAVSRAREQVIVVSSIMPQELRTETLKHEGPRVLKEYLQYAWDCQQFDRNNFFAKHAARIPANSTAEKVVQLCTINESLKVEPIYPFASLTVQHNNTYSLIDTDDDPYRTIEFAKYWHYNKPLLLNTKGWGYQQVLSKSIHAATSDIAIQISRQHDVNHIENKN
ncbi:AAA domain-containing protein [Cytophaga aurantiaca]|uniref:AAA domain-containing protein n=1 Tax=Cytophaga aurantiaca TaxID=29530 RepID=UPI00036436D0|nr:AAA domain-containing protein [Cytophaga aurantiaca]